MTDGTVNNSAVSANEFLDARDLSVPESQSVWDCGRNDRGICPSPLQVGLYLFCIHRIISVFVKLYFSKVNPYPANVENMVSS
jgi:hypothetical protein